MRGLLLLAVLRPICADKQRNSFEGGAIAAEAALSSNAGSVIAPIIFVPGLGGSVLEARLHNRSKHRDCASEADWFSLWFSEVQVLTRYDCFIDNVALSYDASTGSVKGPEGVEVRPKDFGGLAGVRYINSGSSDPIPAPYLKTFLQKFEGLGYKDGVNLRAATYDFRTSGTKAVLQAQFAALRGLVEETVATNSGVRAHLVSHSLGTSFVNIFLQDQDAAWTAKHVASAILMSPTNAGTPVAVQGAIMGPVFPYVPQRLPALVSPAVRTFPSILWMFPSEDGGGGGAPVWGNHTFIRTPSANYSIGNLDVLLRDMNATVLEPVFSEVSDLGRRWRVTAMQPPRHRHVTAMSPAWNAYASSAGCLTSAAACFCSPRLDDLPTPTRHVTVPRDRPAAARFGSPGTCPPSASTRTTRRQRWRLSPTTFSSPAARSSRARWATARSTSPRSACATGGRRRSWSSRWAARSRATPTSSTRSERSMPSPRGSRGTDLGVAVESSRPHTATPLTAHRSPVAACLRATRVHVEKYVARAASRASSPHSRRLAIACVYCLL